MKFPCPSCGFLVFKEGLGSYDICPICEWEDDVVQQQFPGSKIGANKRSLYETQMTILNKLPIEITEFNGFNRDKNWRPLYKDDVIEIDEPRNGQEYFNSAGSNKIQYYWEIKK